MKHIKLSNVYTFTDTPFPAFRGSLIFGRNKRDRGFLPVKGIVPSQDEEGVYTTLPDDMFRVIKTKEKGTLIVVPGEDTTGRCFLQVGCYGAFRGGVMLLEEATTGRILTQISAGNACESQVECIAILKENETVGFHSYGRGKDQVTVYTWKNEEITISKYTKKEWDQSRELTDSDAIENSEEI